MPIDQMVQISRRADIELKEINKLIENAMNITLRNPQKDLQFIAGQKLTDAERKLEKLAVAEGKSIGDYSQYGIICTAWNYFRDPEHYQL